MTLTDIQRIEHALSVKLPGDYQQLLLDYPFSADSFATACMVINDADALIKLNNGPDVHFQLHHRKGRWTPEKNHFLIHAALLRHVRRGGRAGSDVGRPAPSGPPRPPSGHPQATLRLT